MLSSPNTSICFQPTDTVVSDKKQMITALKERNSLICKHEYRIKTKRDNVIDAICNPTTACLSCQKNIFLEKNNGRMFLLELRNSLFAKLNPFYVNPVAGK